MPKIATKDNQINDLFINFTSFREKMNKPTKLKIWLNT